MGIYPAYDIITTGYPCHYRHRDLQVLQLLAKHESTRSMTFGLNRIEVALKKTCCYGTSGQQAELVKLKD